MDEPPSPPPGNPATGPYLPELTASAAGKRQGTPTWAVVVIVLSLVGVLAVPAVGVLAAMAIYGVRRYIYAAKLAEPRGAINVLARGMDECFTERGALPDSSSPVPASLSSVAGRKYQSSAAEWSDDAFACARFAMVDPQYFQYQWVRESETRGYWRAAGDLDGDGNPSELRLSITCTTAGCTFPPQIDERDPME